MLQDIMNWFLLRKNTYNQDRYIVGRVDSLLSNLKACLNSTDEPGRQERYTKACQVLAKAKWLIDNPASHLLDKTEYDTIDGKWHELRRLSDMEAAGVIWGSNGNR